MSRALIFLLGFSVFVQVPDQFEAAIVKPSLPSAKVSSRLDGSQFLCTAHTLQLLIMSAYPDVEVQPWKLLGGPSWMKTDLWDFSAKLPAGMPTEQEPLYRATEAMLRNFLAEQFKLSTHRESREMSVYSLVVDKGGARLKPSQSDQMSLARAPGGIEFRHTGMAYLARYLSPADYPRPVADRIVLDKTGLTGFYDFTLQWIPDGAALGPEVNAPSLSAALEQQLDLRLVPAKITVDALVVDHAEKPVN